MRQDVPITLEGLGTVVAYNTVAVRPQVDGKLDQVLFKEGDAVEKGQLLAQIDPRPFQIQLHQAEGALARDQAQLSAARRNLERYQELEKQSLIPKQQVDDQRAAVDQSSGAIRVDEAAVEAAKLNLTYARITAPISGVAGIRLVDPGNLVRSADPSGIVLLTQIDPIAILVTLPEDDLPRVSRALAEGPVTVEAFNRDGRDRLGVGRVLLVDNQINSSTGTIRLKVIIDNPQHLLWPNQFVKARVLLETKKQAITVPATAIARGPQGPYVYVVNPDHAVEQRPVKIEPGTDDLTIVDSGLSGGEQVVIEGQSQLKPGVHVEPRPVSPAPPRPDEPRPGAKAPPAPEPSTSPDAGS